VTRRFSVELAATAEADVRGIRDHISRDNPTAARKWVAAIARQIALLESFPRRGAVIPEARFLRTPYRHLLYGTYRMIYRIEGERVLVIRVLHGARLVDSGNVP
jgi:toxin ParE1/3/4